MEPKKRGRTEGNSIGGEIFGGFAELISDTVGEFLPGSVAVFLLVVVIVVAAAAYTVRWLVQD
jgi:hypothetical protein